MTTCPHCGAKAETFSDLAHVAGCPLHEHTHVLGNALDVLSQFDSWSLHRISPRTFPPDIRLGPELGLYCRAGKLFRCRIGKGPYGYGLSADDAAVAAIQAYRDALATGPRGAGSRRKAADGGQHGK